MRRRIKHDNSPQLAEAFAAFLAVSYLAFKYGPSNWEAVILGVISLVVFTALILIIWKRYFRSNRPVETKPAPTINDLTVPPH